MRKDQQFNRTMKKGMEREEEEVETEMANTHDSLVIRGMKIKSRRKHHFPPSCGQEFKKCESTKCWLGCRGLGTQANAGTTTLGSDLAVPKLKLRITKWTKSTQESSSSRFREKYEPEINGSTLVAKN